MEEWGHKPGHADQRANYALFLSLYLLLLAFFILLTSISSHSDVKSKAVIESLSHTFAEDGPGGLDDPFVGAFGEQLAARAFLEQMAEVFQSAIPAAKVAMVRPGRLMQVELLADSLFLDQSAETRPAQAAFLDRLIAAVSVPPPGRRYEIEITVGITPQPGGILPIGETLETARAGGLARTLVQRGLPAAALTTGAAPGDPAHMRILFRLLGQDEGRFRFTGH